MMKKNCFVLLLTFVIAACGKQPVPEVQQRVADVNEIKLYYEIAGTGTPLVFIHGNGVDCRQWNNQFGALSENFQVIRYDVRGYGQSAFSDPDVVYNDYEDVKQLLDYLDITQAHICGSSMGSGIAVDFALAYPDRCMAVIHAGPWVNGYDSPAVR